MDRVEYHIGTSPTDCQGNHLNVFKSGGGSTATLQLANITATFHPN